MGAIVLDINKVNSYVLPSLNKSTIFLRSSYSSIESLKNTLPNTYNQRSVVNEITNQIYSVNKEINNVKKIIQSKIESAKRIETKTESRVSSIAQSATKIGASVSSAAVGAVIGATTTKTTKAVVNTSTTKTTTSKNNTGAKTLWGKFVSGVKKVVTDTAKAIKDTAAKIAKAVKSIWQKFSKTIKNLGNKVVNATKKVGKAIYNTGAKVVKGVVSGVKKVGSAIVDGFKWVGSKVVSGVKTAAKWVKDTTKTVTSWVADKFNKAKNWTSNALKSAGAWISKKAKSAWSWLKDAGKTVWTHMKKIGASIANGFIALTKGLVRLVEAIGDLAAILNAAGHTGLTALYDVGKGLCTGKWDWSATKGLWKKTKSIVAYDATSKIYGKLYDTKFGKWLDDNAYAPFKSDGIGCKILEGVGYVAGVVALSIVTFGAAGAVFGASATVMGVTVNAGAVALTAAAAGIGKYTQEEWNKNSLSITYGGQEVGLTIDYEKYCEIEKLGDGESTTITQKMQDENGNPFELKFTITKNGDTYSIVDGYGNAVGFNGVKESSTVKGLAMGTLKGLGDGFKYYTAVSTIGNVQQFTSMANSIGGGNTLQGFKTMFSNFGVKQSLKPLATTAAKNTFTDIGFYIDSGTHIYTDVETYMKTGEFNLLKTGAKIAGAYGINFLGNLGGQYFSRGLNTSLTNIQTAKQLDYNQKIGQQLEDIDSQILNAEQLGDYDEIARLQQQKSLLNQEYYSTMYGADNVELTSGIGVEGSNGSIIGKNDVVASRTIVAKGGSYDNLDEICAKHGITREEYLALTRTKQQNMTEAQRKLTFEIRKELTMDVTDSAGVILPGTKVSKSIDADTFAAYYKDGDAATLGGCIALERDTSVFGGNATEIIDSTGLRFDGSKFVDASGNPNEFYIVEGALSAGQSDVAIRVSATTDATEISDTILDQFRKKYPDYKYNGYDVSDVSSSNDTYLNEIWTRNSESQVKKLSEISGVSEKNIVTEQARWYNRGNNPDMGNGTTLNQGNSDSYGLPEFFAKERVGLSDGEIYRISNGEKVKVADIVGGIVYRI